MKIRKKYFVAEFATDLYHDDEAELFLAESAEAVEQEVRKTLGEHLLCCYVRKPTWAERRQIRKSQRIPCVVQ